MLARPAFSRARGDTVTGSALSGSSPCNVSRSAANIYYQGKPNNHDFKQKCPVEDEIQGNRRSEIPGWKMANEHPVSLCLL
jgi:hypothetical protein